MVQSNKERLHFAVCRNATIGAHVQRGAAGALVKIASHAVVRQILKYAICDSRTRFRELGELQMNTWREICVGISSA